MSIDKKSLKKYLRNSCPTRSKPAKLLLFFDLFRVIRMTDKFLTPLKSVNSYPKSL